MCTCPALRPRRDLHVRPWALREPIRDSECFVARDYRRPCLFPRPSSNPLTSRCSLPHLSRRRLPQRVISGLNHTAYTLAVYAPQRELPHHHVRLASDWWPALVGRDWSPAGFHYKVSVSILTTSSLTTRLPWRTIGEHPSDRWRNASRNDEVNRSRGAAHHQARLAGTLLLTDAITLRLIYLLRNGGQEKLAVLGRDVQEL